MSVFVLTLIVSGSWILVRANGYQILLDPLRFVKTGVITVRVHPDNETTFTLNDVVIRGGRFDVADLTPGRYTLRLQRDQFVTWEETVELAAGQALRFEDIILFYENPETRLVTESEREIMDDVLNSRDDFRSGLQIIGGEVWNEDELVTRYSTAVTDALWLPGRTHILAKVGQALHVLEKSGEQDIVLVQIPETTENVRFAPLSGGAQLVVDLDGVYWLYDITLPKTLLHLPSFQRFSSPVE